MSEKSEQTKKKIAENADKITIGVLAAILVAFGFFYWKEQSTSLPDASSAGRTADLQDKLGQSTALQMLQNMSPQPDINRSRGVASAVRHSMFDNSNAAAEAAEEATADQYIAAAKQSIEQKDLEKAREYLEAAQSLARYKLESTQLLDSITTKPETAESAPENPDQI